MLGIKNKPAHAHASVRGRCRAAAWGDGSWASKPVQGGAEQRRRQATKLSPCTLLMGHHLAVAALGVENEAAHTRRSMRRQQRGTAHWRAVVQGRRRGRQRWASKAKPRTLPRACTGGGRQQQRRATKPNLCTLLRACARAGTRGPLKGIGAGALEGSSGSGRRKRACARSKERAQAAAQRGAAVQGRCRAAVAAMGIETEPGGGTGRRRGAAAAGVQAHAGQPHGRRKAAAVAGVKIEPAAAAAAGDKSTLRGLCRAAAVETEPAHAPTSVRRAVPGGGNAGRQEQAIEPRTIENWPVGACGNWDGGGGMQRVQGRRADGRGGVQRVQGHTGGAAMCKGHAGGAESVERAGVVSCKVRRQAEGRGGGGGVQTVRGRSCHTDPQLIKNFKKKSTVINRQAKRLSVLVENEALLFEAPDLDR
ncbi:hypothetical protein GGX14DRAFT_391149 [Mycena pura]|uniref:Uncharacterized protein n=1 Tax=Mycena pura TaxID=153505 RepID=A0AAD6VL89_9AGAR|nr:hypothetical protein GGX14DRAFT_391149 [Mycena pura]